MVAGAALVVILAVLAGLSVFGGYSYLEKLPDDGVDGALAYLQLQKQMPGNLGLPHVETCATLERDGVDLLPQRGYSRVDEGTVSSQ